MEIHELLDRFELLYPHNNNLADLRRAYVDKDQSSIFRLLGMEDTDLRSAVMDKNIHSIFRLVSSEHIDIEELRKSRRKLINQSVNEAYFPEPVNETKLIIDTRLSSGGILSLHTDITELKNTQKIQESLLEAVDELPMVIDIWDENDNLFFNNKSSSLV